MSLTGACSTSTSGTANPAAATPSERVPRAPHAMQALQLWLAADGSALHPMLRLLRTLPFGLHDAPYLPIPSHHSHHSHPSTPASSKINRYSCDSPSEGGTSVSGGYLRLTANNDSSGGFVGARVDTAHYMSVVPGMAGTDGTAYNTIAVEMRTKFPPPGGWAGRLQAGGRGRACGRCLASRATGSPCMCGYSSWVQHALRAVLQARGCGRPGGCTLTR